MVKMLKWVITDVNLNQVQVNAISEASAIKVAKVVHNIEYHMIDCIGDVRRCKEYYITIMGVGIMIDQIRKDENLVWFYNDGNVIFHIDLRWYRLKFRFKDERNDLFFHIVAIK